MKKSSILVLTLVAVMTACNKNTGPNDWFSKQGRGLGLSSSQKNQVINMNEGVIMVTQYQSKTEQAHKSGNTWVYEPSYSYTYTYNRTTLSFDKNSAGSVAFGSYESTSSSLDPTQFQNVFVIGKSSSGYEFTNNNTAITSLYLDSAKDIYFKMFDSFFEWNISLLSGMHHYLILKDTGFAGAMVDIGTENNQFAKNYTLGGTVYSLGGAIAYSDGGKDFTLTTYDATYINHRLEHYHATILIETLTSPNTKTMKTINCSLYKVTYGNL